MPEFKERNAYEKRKCKRKNNYKKKTLQMKILLCFVTISLVISGYSMSDAEIVDPYKKITKEEAQAELDRRRAIRLEKLKGELEKRRVIKLSETTPEGARRKLDRNWKIFYKGSTRNMYYDKNSIHYPYKTKGWFGRIVPDKSRVRVWTKHIDNAGIETGSVLYGINCHRRQYSIEIVIEFKEKHELGYNVETITPDSTLESLYNKVCD